MVWVKTHRTLEGQQSWDTVQINDLREMVALAEYSVLLI